VLALEIGGIPLTAEGRYLFVMTLDGDLIAELPLTVTIRPDLFESSVVGTATDDSAPPAE
jgi:hypothetical protein